MFCLLACSLTGAALLSAGCGAATNAINSSIPPVTNLLNLDGQTVSATVNGSRAAISGNGAAQVEFGDRSLPQADRLNFVRFGQGLERTVTVAVPDGVSLPGSFALSNIALSFSVSDAAPRNVSASGTVAGPITFVRVGTTNQYQAATGDITFSDIQIGGGNFDTFLNIVTSAPTPNSASGRVSFDTDTDQLPAGTVLTFTFVNGQARVGI